MLNAIIVEDEKHSQETLKNLLTEFCEGVHIVGMSGNVEDAISMIKKEKPDLLFLDIELNSGTGFDVLKEVAGLNFEVIFTTAFEHYAIRAVKFSSLDYLLKPIDLDELEKAIEKAKNKKAAKDQQLQLELLLANLKEPSTENKKICLASSDGLEFIEVKDIICCEASGSYTNFYLAGDKKIVVSKHLKEYENLLADHQFMRVHNSYLVNLKQVRKLVKTDGGYILMNNNMQVGISQRKRDEFLAAMAKV